MSSKIAVIIPLYNKQPHIAKALSSILAQSSIPDEIIVIDDGSTDNGAEVVQQFLDRGVRLIRQNNQGVSSARNAGIETASADYVAFLDADDFWRENHVETLRMLISEFPDAALLSTAHEIFRNGEIIRPSSAFNDDWVGMVPDFFASYCIGLSLIHTSTACAKRIALVKVGGFPKGVRRGEDIITWIKLALLFPVAHAEMVTAVYNCDACNRSDRQHEIEPPGSLTFIHELLQDHTLSDENKKSIGKLFDRIAFFTSAGFRLAGDYTGATAIRRLVFSARRWGLAIALLFLLLVPRCILHWAQRVRHKRSAP